MLDFLPMSGTTQYMILCAAVAVAVIGYSLIVMALDMRAARARARIDAEKLALEQARAGLDKVREYGFEKVTEADHE